MSGTVPNGPGGEKAEPPLAWYDTRSVAIRTTRERNRALRRRRRIDALACLSVSALWFSQAGSETLFRADRDFYSRLPLSAPALLAIILDIVALAAAGLAAVELIRRARRPLARRLAAAAAAIAVLIALNYVRITYDSLGGWIDLVGRPGLLVLALLAVGASVAWPGRALFTIRRAALVASPVAALTLLHASWMFLELAAGPVPRRIDPTPLKSAPPSLRRVVWLVFEELDQRLTFEERPANLELPELDRLRRESLYADAARPPAGTTDLSMPALIIGRPVVSAVPITSYDLELRFTDGKTARWSTHPNVFSRARGYGYDTAVVGWHFPYPRVLGGALGFAEWRPSVAHEQTRGLTMTEAVENQWGSLAPPLHARRIYADRVAEVGDLALRTALDGRFGLVLLHLPLPQAPGIYDPATGRLSRWHFVGARGEYLDNLALIDRLLGELRRGLVRARMLDRTWIVLSSDRWHETAKRDDRHVDHRVPFLVRPPEGGRGVHADGEFNTVATHDLVLAILRGSVEDVGAAATWLARNPSAAPKDDRAR